MNSLRKISKKIFLAVNNLQKHNSSLFNHLPALKIISTSLNNNLLFINQIQLNQIRQLSKERSSNKSGKKSNNQDEDEDEEENDTDYDDEDDSYIKSIDTSGFKPGFKIIQKHIPSLRVDSLLSAGLNLSRKKIDDSFYSSKIRLNGEKVLKKSQAVKATDRVDLIGEIDEKSRKRVLKRVYLEKVLDSTSKNNKPKVVLVTWKSGLFEEDAYKSVYDN